MLYCIETQINIIYYILYIELIFQLIARPGILLQGIKYINSSKTNENIATSNHIEETKFLNAGLALSHSQTLRTKLPIF